MNKYIFKITVTEIFTIFNNSKRKVVTTLTKTIHAYTVDEGRDKVKEYLIYYGIWNNFTIKLLKVEVLK